MSPRRVALTWLLLSLVACDVNEPKAPEAFVITSDPSDGSDDAPRSGRFVLSLDRLVQPRTVTRANVRITSGAVKAETSIRLWPTALEIWIDIGPEHALEPHVAYLLEVEGLVDLDGNQQAARYSAVFTTGASLGKAPDDSVDARAVHALLATRCVGCHGGAHPEAALDLSSREAIERTAIGKIASGGSGTSGEEGTRGALHLAGLRIIDVVAGRGQPESSYLIYKLLGDPHILGDRMPQGRPGLASPDVELLASWIAAGAL